MGFRDGKNKWAPIAKEHVEFCEQDDFMWSNIEKSRQTAFALADLDYEKTRDSLLSNLTLDDSKETEHLVVPIGVEDAVSMLAKDGSDIAILCFADFVKLGGLFIEGAHAQEECICHFSGMYSILDKFTESYYQPNMRLKNRGQYAHSFGVMENVPWMWDGEKGVMKVVYAAAPNFISAYRYGIPSNSPITLETMKQAMLERQELAYLFAASLGVKVFVAGAWGCGVFKNKPEDVAKGWKICSEKYPGLFDAVIHPIPGVRTANYAVFKDILG